MFGMGPQELTILLILLVAVVAIIMFLTRRRVGGGSGNQDGVVALSVLRDIGFLELVLSIPSRP
jgi:hypothetical protein